LLSELFLPCSGMHSPIRANRYPLTTITGAQRASGQTHSRARSTRIAERASASAFSRGSTLERGQSAQRVARSCHDDWNGVFVPAVVGWFLGDQQRADFPLHRARESRVQLGLCAGFQYVETKPKRAHRLPHLLDQQFAD
jgi:hypothetical protein